MHLTVELEVLNDFAPIGFEGASVVVKGHAGDLADELVGQHGGKLAVDEWILAVFAPAADYVDSLVIMLEEQGDVVRVVLEVGIEGDDDIAGRGVEAGAHGGGLAEVAAQPHEAEMGVLVGACGEQLPGSVLAAVVDEDDLVGAANCAQGVVQGFAEQGDGFFFVVDRNDNG